MPEIFYLEELYLASPETIQACTAQHHGERTRLLCLGHNPGMEMLASQLAKEEVVMKTAHLLVFESEQNWEEAVNRPKAWRTIENIRGEE